MFSPAKVCYVPVWHSPSFSGSILILNVELVSDKWWHTFWFDPDLFYLADSFIQMKHAWICIWQHNSCTKTQITLINVAFILVAFLFFNTLRPLNDKNGFKSVVIKMCVSFVGKIELQRLWWNLLLTLQSINLETKYSDVWWVYHLLSALSYLRASWKCSTLFFFLEILIITNIIINGANKMTMSISFSHKWINWHIPNLELNLYIINNNSFKLWIVLNISIVYSSF